MAGPHCPHLEVYAAQRASTEAAYRRCMDLLDRILADGPGGGLGAEVRQAVADWQAEDEKLREQLVAHVRDGKLRIPAAVARRRTPRREAMRPQGSVACAACGCLVPRLEYAEWRFAHNGAVTYRDVELVSAAPLPV